VVRLRLTAFPFRHHPKSKAVLVAAPGFEPGSRPNLGLAGYKPAALPLSYAAELVRAPACPYLHFPNWRKREVLIPNGARPSISLRTSAGLLSGYVSVFGGRLSARCSYASGVPFALHAMPIPRSVNLPKLSLQIGGAVRCRSPHVAVPRVFETRCRAAGYRSVLRCWRSLGDSNSAPSASEADALLQ
jgi:hypothetical protein